MTTSEMVASEREVTAFFYGSFIRRDVQSNSGFYPDRVEVGRLSGFDIHVCPHAALSRSDKNCVYGIVVDITHRQLDALYSAPGVGVFLPEAVIIETRDRKVVPALCYIPPHRDDRPADRAYLAALVAAALDHGFPDWYIKRLEGMP